MEIGMAQKLSEMEMDEILQLLIKLKLEDIDAFRKLRELVEDL